METIIKKIALSQVTYADYNPRVNLKESDPIEFDKLCKSILKFGYVNLITINQNNNVIIGGHQRHEALEHLVSEGYEEFKEVDMVLVNIKNKDEEMALNLALNKIEGSWDIDKLQVVLEDLDSADIDVSLTGFDELEINDIMISEGDMLINDDLIEGEKKGKEESFEDKNKEIDINEFEEFEHQCPKCGFEFD